MLRASCMRKEVHSFVQVTRIRTCLRQWSGGPPGDLLGKVLEKKEACIFGFLGSEGLKNIIRRMEFVVLLAFLFSRRPFFSKDNGNLRRTAALLLPPPSPQATTLGTQVALQVVIMRKTN